MNSHMKELFEAAAPFDEGEVYQSPEYTKLHSAFLSVLDSAEAFYGRGSRVLLETCWDAYADVERMICLHYFYEGYQAAKMDHSPLP